MQPPLKHLGLTQLEKLCPRSLRRRDRSSGPMSSFLNRAIAAELKDEIDVPQNDA